VSAQVRTPPPLIGLSIPDLSGSFQQFADGLKRRVESGGAPTRRAE